MKRAVVFAYHNVGVRCLKVLAARGIDVALVVTHHDNPAETIWFESVSALCDEMGIPWIAPADPATPELQAQVAAARPDFIFSFYYRHMLPTAVLELAPRGAYNLHGSLLPKYRGRVPVNWAVLHGETETGATLHEMTVKPDAGAIIAQTMVPILPDDTAFEVFGKLAVASEQTLWQALPGLVAGTAPRLPNDLSKGSYFGGRKPEDGRIDWTRPARDIYNLHRAVAPPYPGAWTVLNGRTLVLGRARMAPGSYAGKPGLALHDGQLLGIGGDGQALRIIELLENGKALHAAEQESLLSSAKRED
jgi:methionyl-tRNA formyltransferase